MKLYAIRPKDPSIEKFWNLGSYSWEWANYFSVANHTDTDLDYVSGLVSEEAAKKDPKTNELSDNLISVKTVEIEIVEKDV